MGYLTLGMVLGMAADGDRGIPQHVARVDHQDACAHGEVAE